MCGRDPAITKIHIREDKMEEKRYYARFPVEDFDIHGRMISASEVNLIDISLGGISLKADWRFEMNQKYSLQLEYGEKDIPISGSVVWSTLVGMGRNPHGALIYKAGMKLDRLLTDELNVIVDLLRSRNLDINAMKEVCKDFEQKVNTGFHTGLPRKNTLILPARYQLKNITPGNMIIEGEHELEVQAVLPMEIWLSGNDSFSFTGRVAFCIKAEDSIGPVYCAGIEFMDMQEKHGDELKRFFRMIQEKAYNSCCFVKIFSDAAMMERR